MIQSSISTEVSTEVCEEFKKSIICTLSLSSKELFHSNMIGWLIENNLDFARNILERPDLDSERKVEREKYNFDLLVTANGEKFVIENKVKSLPDYKQLQEYRKKMDAKKESEVQYILISLIAPGAEFKNSFIRVISYENIIKWISNLKSDDVYLSALFKDYKKLLDALIHVKEVAAHINDDKELSFSKSNEMILREIRLFDVAQKIRYSRFEALCHSRLEGINLRDRLNIRVGFSMSMGRIDIEALFPATSLTKPLLLGIEIQNDQYRLFVASQNGWNVANLANVLKENNLWLTSPNGNCGKILKFGDEFKYSYFSIKGKTVGNLLNHIEEDIGRLLSNLNKIEEVIKKVISTQA